MLGQAFNGGNPGFEQARTNQSLFKNGSRRHKEADFGAKNTSASSPRRLRLLRDDLELTLSDERNDHAFKK